MEDMLLPAPFEYWNVAKILDLMTLRIAFASTTPLLAVDHGRSCARSPESENSTLNPKPLNPTVLSKNYPEKPEGN